MSEVETELRSAGHSGLTVLDLYSAFPKVPPGKIRDRIERLVAQEKAYKRRYRGPGRTQWRYVHSESATVSGWQIW